MRLLDRYIFKRLLITFFFVVFILMLIIVVIDVTEKMEKFTNHELGWLVVIDYYLDYIPFIASMITPLTAFIATVYITARMAGHSEIIAMLSSGMSFKRMIIPYLLGAIVIGGLNFYLTGWIIPKSNRDKLEFEIKYLEKPFVYSERDVHLQEGSDIYIYLRGYNNNSNEGQQFTLEKMEGNTLKEKLSARSIVWKEEIQKWKIKDWKHWTMEDEKEVVTTGKEMDTTLAINPKEFSNNYRQFDGMTLTELDEYIIKLKERGAGNIEVYEVEKYVRFTSPFTVIILTMMGVIVASRKSRGGTGFRIALGFLLSFIFILCFILTKSIAEVGDLDPMLSVWIPNIIFGTIALFMYKNVPK